MFKTMFQMGKVLYDPLFQNHRSKRIKKIFCWVAYEVIIQQHAAQKVRQIDREPVCQIVEQKQGLVNSEGAECMNSVTA